MSASDKSSSRKLNALLVLVLLLVGFVFGAVLDAAFEQPWSTHQRSTENAG